VKNNHVKNNPKYLENTTYSYNRNEDH
jgi:hypothetical protein